MNKVLGTCICPLPWCKAPGAEVREGEKGKLYVICDECVSMVRTQSRKGQVGMRAAVVPAPAAAPAPAAQAVEEKKAEPAKRKGLGLGWA